MKVAWMSSFSTKSNFAREFADEVGIAASLGWITTSQGLRKGWGRSWYITPEGLHALQQMGYYDAT